MSLTTVPKALNGARIPFVIFPTFSCVSPEIISFSESLTRRPVKECMPFIIGLFLKSMSPPKNVSTIASLMGARTALTALSTLLRDVIMSWKGSRRALTTFSTTLRPATIESALYPTKRPYNSDTGTRAFLIAPMVAAS